MSTLRTAPLSGENPAIQKPAAKDSPMQDKETIEKCRKLLRINKEGDAESSIKAMVEHFDSVFFGFIVGQRKSSLQKNVTTRRVRPTPVGKPQSDLPIKDIETPVAQLVKSPTKSATGETVQKVVLMTPSMADSFAKSVQKEDKTLPPVVRSLDLDLDRNSVGEMKTKTLEAPESETAAVKADISSEEIRSRVHQVKESCTEVSADSPDLGKATVSQRLISAPDNVVKTAEISPHPVKVSTSIKSASAADD